jgi:hypothetical protein
MAPFVEEPESVDVFGVALDGERAGVVEPVVERAQGAQVRADGEAAVFAVVDVVDLHPAAL